MITGKVTYFTALFPYIVLVILFGYSLTLEGASNGIKTYITPNATVLAEPEAWMAAANQILISISVSLGGLMTLSSYNKFNNNIHRDAWIISVVNSATSVFSGFVVFAILGYMSVESGYDQLDLTEVEKLEKVSKGGVGLFFITFPEVVSKMPGQQLWSLLFFLMVITLGLDSMFAMVETMATAVNDTLGLHAKNPRYKMFVTFSVCLVCFLCGLSMVTRGGLQMLELIDGTVDKWLILIALIEVSNKYAQHLLLHRYR